MKPRSYQNAKFISPNEFRRRIGQMQKERGVVRMQEAPKQQPSYADEEALWQEVDIARQLFREHSIEATEIEKDLSKLGERLLDAKRARHEAFLRLKKALVAAGIALGIADDAKYERDR